MTVRLYLVRHGETEMNRAQKLQGVTDAPLTAKGQEAAEKLGALLAPIHFDAAYSSDRKRAITTAQAILAVHPDAPRLQEKAGLREYYFGGNEGMKNTALMRKTTQRFGLRAFAKMWLDAPQFRTLVRNFHAMDDTGQAETLEELTGRVRRVFTTIVAANQPDADVLVVAHGISLSALIYQLAPQTLPVTMLKNTSVTRVDVTGSDWQVRGVDLTATKDILALAGKAPKAPVHDQK
ncbi:histidine phosphatase family protein [Lacticaseibacillus jixianensis]|uniref:Histidine phosphatase family protein n=1 Tax=Lacticaseibacillus jixianensis TaxID=2486012 RepID=A0ABW4BBL9_9LACO|nr:histidine phosphatase family protein [Lacticaseibacillus jixianensis]